MGSDGFYFGNKITTITTIKNINIFKLETGILEAFGIFEESGLLLIEEVPT